MEGWIKIHRAMRDWEWKKDPNMMALFIDLLLKASYKDTKFQGIEIKRGEVVTNLRALSEDTGLSVKQIRNCLSKLEKTNEISRKRAHKFMVLVINNFEKFQTSDKERARKGHEKGTERAREGHEKGNIIRNKEYKEYNNINNNIAQSKQDEKVCFDASIGKLIIPDFFLAKLKESFNCDIEGEIKKAEVWLVANPKKRKKSYERFLINWMSRAKPKPEQPKPVEYDESEVEILGPIVDISKIRDLKKDPGRVRNAIQELVAKKTVTL